MSLARLAIGPAYAAAASTDQVQAGDTLTSIAPANQTSAMCPDFAIDDLQIVRHVRVACPPPPTVAAPATGTTQVLKTAASPVASVASTAKPVSPTPVAAAAKPATPTPANPTAKPVAPTPAGKPATSAPAASSAPLAPPYHSQFDGSPYAETNCGPTSLSMALGALHITVDQLTLRKLANVQLGTSDPNSGTTWSSLIYAAQKEGVKVTGPSQGQGASQRPWSIADLEAQVRQGHPVLVLVRYQDLPGNTTSGFTSDHYVVVYGVDGKGNLIYNDPAFRSNGGAHLTISPDALTRAWTNTSEGLVRTAIALSK